MSEGRLPVDQMPGLLRRPHVEVPLGLYRHYKGETYAVVGGTFDATGEGQVVAVQYVHVESGSAAHRTPEDSLATVPVGHPPSMWPRFRLIRELTQSEVMMFVLLAALIRCTTPPPTSWFLHGEHGHESGGERS